MCSTLIRLKPFEALPEIKAFSCSVRVRYAGPVLMLRYTIRGPLRQIVIPAATDRPENTAGLWRTTCLECFLRPENSCAYTEWNFSPSGNWWVCVFEDYRTAAPLQVDSPRPVLRLQRSREFLFVHITLPLTSGARVSVDPALILEHTGGLRSHWAITHPFEHPDFHRSSGMGIAVQGLQG